MRAVGAQATAAVCEVRGAEQPFPLEWGLVPPGGEDEERHCQMELAAGLQPPGISLACSCPGPVQPFGRVLLPGKVPHLLHLCCLQVGA